MLRLALFYLIHTWRLTPSSRGAITFWVAGLRRSDHTKSMAFSKLVWSSSLDGQKGAAGTTNEPNLTDKKECVWYIISWCVRNAIYFVHELKATPVKPEESHHDKPLPLPAGSGGCVICKRRTKYCCWGCTSTLGGVIPVCLQSERPECNVELHNMQNQIWTPQWSKRCVKKSLLFDTFDSRMLK